MAKSTSAGNRSLSQLFAFMSLAHALIALAAIRRASFFASSLASMSAYPQKRTLELSREMSALCQKQTLARLRDMCAQILVQIAAVG